MFVVVHVGVVGVGRSGCLFVCCRGVGWSSPSLCLRGVELREVGVGGRVVRVLCSVVSRDVCLFVWLECSGDTRVLGILAAAQNRQGSGDSVVVLIVRGWLRARALMVVLMVVLWVEFVVCLVVVVAGLAELKRRARALCLVGSLLLFCPSDGCSDDA